MAALRLGMVALLLATPCAGLLPSVKRTGGVGHDRHAALLQSWGQALDNGKASDTPVARVVKLLKEMGATLKKEMEEDEQLYDKMACWCNSNKYEKTEAITEAEAKVADLDATIESLTAKASELKTAIGQLEADTASGKDALASAAALREKEGSEFHGTELESIKAIENLKAAIEVLSKHHGAALPQMSLMLPSASFLSVRGRGRKGRDIPWEDEHESRLARSFDDFLQEHGFESEPDPAKKIAAAPKKVALASEVVEQSWTDGETATIKRALRSASAFMQARHGEDYYPSYRARSGEIMGLLKELKEQMEADLSESQKAELARKTAFEELRASKQAEVDAAEKQAEQKEDELATASMKLAEAKEDKEQTAAALAEDQQFALNLKTTCEDADANFEQRKNARLAEIQAVSDAVAILSADEARDTMSRTYAFLQVNAASGRSRRGSEASAKAAAVLRHTASKINSPELSVLASKVELDSFARVKKAIDDMVKMLEVEQADEVKKHDWCNAELHDNEVTNAKTEDRKAELSTKIDELGASIEKFGDEATAAKDRIAQLQVDLQRANENRQKENTDFQATIADQRATQALLKKALERLATYYSQAEFIQKQKKSIRSSRQLQTPPVPQMEYKPSAAGNNVMSLLEKLVHEAQALEKEALTGENGAQAQYEALIADTNAAVKGLQAEVTFKVGAKADASKEKTEVEGDLVDTVDELEGLDKYKGELHSQCDYLVKNFAVRQEARSQEVEALKQAKQILSGADLS